LHFGDDGGGMVAANVVESAQDAVFAARDDDRFFTQLCCEELPVFPYLIDAPGDLPATRENPFVFQASDARIEIPERRDGGSFL
jgi:hypothetical protein